MGGRIIETEATRIFTEGKTEGRDEGRATEIVSIYREEGYPDQFILEKLQSKLHIAADQAMEFLLAYGKQPA
ncbi:MAG: hypothetical protein LUI10_04890 [Lachnospiraceae bacterium]|nr:hypothetical protein [Lachnospiraceae bacterium]